MKKLRIIEHTSPDGVILSYNVPMDTYQHVGSLLTERIAANIDRPNAHVATMRRAFSKTDR